MNEGTEASTVSTPAFENGTAGGPTVLRIVLGANLRRLRETLGITREDAGWHIRASESKISRMELGRVSFKERDVADLLTFYGVNDDEERERLLSLAREANTPGWWQRYSDLLNSWFQPYIGLENAAALIRSFEVQFVPGLLQTEAYARAVIRRYYPHSSDEDNERRLEARMIRQNVLTRPDPLQFWAVLDEAALHRPMGGKRVLREQIEYLIEVTRLPNVRVQVVPFGLGEHGAHGGAFSILRFAEPDLPDIVYVEQLTGALYLDKREDVDQYAETMEVLCIEAAQPDETVELLRRLAGKIDIDED